MNTYFVTGASGAVGSALVPLLYADTRTRVRILLRAKSEQHLTERMEELCRFWKLAPDAEPRTRLTALRGDASQPRFGLSDREYATLCTDTTHIIHCAASVRMNDTLDHARRSAVGSAQEILSLARTLARSGTLRKVDFVSTVGIAGKRPGALPERWIAEPRAFHNTYEQSKAEAEVLVRAAIEEEHLPITVHRPSMVIGDSRDGRIIHFQIFYFICEFLSGRRTYGVLPDLGEVRLDIIPVDAVAGAIARASLDPDTVGRIYHLCSGPNHSIRLKTLRQLVRDAFARHGISVPFGVLLPHALFSLLQRTAARFAPADRRRTISTLPIYLDYLGDQQGFDNREYLTWLSGTGARLPQWEDYLSRVIERFLSERHPPPQR
ncbi:SDR family oxidoreductase [Aromatoleum anaerobium]|uniref:NAD-dependent epimerase/dehydratase family protein n=1 Tax=Aromatoleum anaerobium TaxID=182180 RepID=A0ABX1PKX5_9RHOO|nr:SDR family oxidoreductase [Aromatoleum anaerobium]MCK0505560.1 SDR family oxidoreductase [Aromatoleum anaerobium]